EIDPGVEAGTDRQAGFLRTRGDRPQAGEVQKAGSLVPPHARRSTLADRRSSCPCPGSSARAEIDLIRLGFRPPTFWFLRTRGDRPASQVTSSNSNWVPPHARRSTPDDGDTPVDPVGSSARAEIDPLLSERERY